MVAILHNCCECVLFWYVVVIYDMRLLKQRYIYQIVTFVTE